MLFRALIPTTVPNFKTTPFLFPIFPSLPGLYTANVQCVRPWPSGTLPNVMPVPSRHSIACFRQCRHSSSDAFLQCLQRCWHWGYINFVFHINPQEEITWHEIWRSGNRGTSSRPAHPIQRCSSSLLRKSRTSVLRASHEAGF
ncbi:hypothetical protein AVEN_142728-1 [Araneus ventricosus]|uniref:Uncharacterized protein n=1 Tax=Araneus ventricosus TaxID=182803 RepID=A0A4Y2FCZ3_ARAVE|nr:hypothetical protein AVEN_142728-1 [Araneus ventricosus]